MTRTQIRIGAALSAAALVTVLMIPQRTTAQQQRTCADPSRQTLAIRMARDINSQETSARQRTNAYQPMDAFPALNVPGWFAIQVVTNSTGSAYAFSVKDTQDPCGFTVFSDQEQVIYTAQPLRPTR
jgi:hypothetical protein